MNMVGCIRSVYWKEVYRAGEYLSYQRGIPVFSSLSNRKAFWNAQAEALHARWGKGNWDFHILSQIIEKHKVRSVLDVGCGSGRLFPLYGQMGIRNVLGMDISGRALEIARQRFPEVSTLCVAIDSEPLPAGFWDLAVSNRVLQHIPQSNIGVVIEKLCKSCRLVYINELSQSDDERELFFMRRYDYERLFGMRGYQMLEKGMLDKQTYWLFGQNCERD